MHAASNLDDGMDDASRISEGQESSNVFFIAVTLSTLSLAGKGSTQDGGLPERDCEAGATVEEAAEDDTTDEMHRWYEALMQVF